MSHAKAQRRKEYLGELCAFAALREVFLSVYSARRNCHSRFVARRIAAIVSILVLFSGAGCGIAFADGGKLRVMQHHGDQQVTVFTSPNPLRAGPIDVSVLVQDAKTGQAVTDAAVIVELARPDDSIPPIRTAATTATATNKLLYAAQLELPSPGFWDVCVQCSIPPQTRTEDTSLRSDLRWKPHRRYRAGSSFGRGLLGQSSRCCCSRCTENSSPEVHPTPRAPAKFAM